MLLETYNGKESEPIMVTDLLAEWGVAGLELPENGVSPVPENGVSPAAENGVLPGPEPADGPTAAVDDPIGLDTEVGGKLSKSCWMLWP